MTIPIFAQNAASQIQAASSTTTSLIFLAIILISIAAIWRVFERAGERGWAVLVPFYNMYVLTRVAQVSGWWMVAMFVPGVNIIASFVVSIGVARRFERSAGFGIGLVFLPFIFYPMLAWGDGEAVPAARMA